LTALSHTGQMGCTTFIFYFIYAQIILYLSKIILFQETYDDMCKKNKRSPHPYTRKDEGQNFIEIIRLGITGMDGDCMLA
jgi:hypothetical protein